MTRYQYRIVDLGIFKAMERMVESFGDLGSQGWQLVATYDKSSNWFTALEKGFMLFMREVPLGEEPEGPWASRYVNPREDDGYNAW